MLGFKKTVKSKRRRFSKKEELFFKNLAINRYSSSSHFSFYFTDVAFKFAHFQSNEFRFFWAKFVIFNYSYLPTVSCQKNQINRFDVYWTLTNTQEICYKVFRELCARLLFQI